MLLCSYLKQPCCAEKFEEYKKRATENYA
uniref:Uncharacterized protein n=1 Tax=Arundo donax TaxID=35708 RepID=A0A0A9AE25_ARUDO